jgi:hypothetical protein
MPKLQPRPEGTTENGRAPLPSLRDALLFRFADPALKRRAWSLDIFRAARPLPMEPALKARSIPAQGSTLGKPALLGSCALQGRSSLFQHVSIIRQNLILRTFSKSLQRELRASLKCYEMALDERYLWD